MGTGEPKTQEARQPAQLVSPRRGGGDTRMQELKCLALRSCLLLHGGVKRVNSLSRALLNNSSYSLTLHVDGLKKSKQ